MCCSDWFLGSVSNAAANVTWRRVAEVSRERRSLALTILLALTLLSASCSLGSDAPVAIQTSPNAGTVCLLMGVEGLLVSDPTWGLALVANPAGRARRYGVIWPHGYSARRDGWTITLLDAGGTVVAREGDTVVLDAQQDDPLKPCGLSN